jgi:hypothetical protein
MGDHRVKILESVYINPDVKRFRIERPPGYAFVPGQGAYVSIDPPEGPVASRPFTFTSLQEWPDLELIIRIYRDVARAAKVPVKAYGNSQRDTFAGAQYIGNVLESNRGALSVGGTISAEGDVDWYTFALNYEQLQSIGGVNDGPYAWATMFDLDYADGFRGDLTISVFDSTGTLLYVGRDSNVADDQPGTSQGNDFDRHETRHEQLHAAPPF